MAKDSGEKKKGIFHALLFREVDKPEDPKAEVSGLGPALSGTSPAEPVDQDIFAQLSKVLVESNVEGYDYFEFRSAVENMRAMIPGEAERFKAAYAAVASFVQPEKLTQSIEFYLGKLQAKQQEFEASVKGAFAQRVGAKEEQAKTDEGRITELNNQIAQLTSEITKLQGSRSSALNEAVAERAKIEQVKSRFASAYNKIVGDIQSDLTKIKTYLTKGVA